MADVGHPERFAPDDPLLADLREVCLGFPGAAENVSHGYPACFTKKTFAMFGAVVQGRPPR